MSYTRNREEVVVCGHEGCDDGQYCGCVRLLSEAEINDFDLDERDHQEQFEERLSKGVEAQRYEK